ncbi:MAG: endonuclease III [Fimbriimonadales bacterium]|nr:endonuclease III [Fimbriimonadales bacterium]
MPTAWTPEAIERLLTDLEALYGRPRFVPRFDPMEELVSCILSQHTADANSFPAFTRLRETFPDWQAVVDAGPERVAEVVRQAGLANQKARSIIGALKAIRERVGDYSLEHLRLLPMEEARRWLMELPGVGPKTASIVLCFSFGMGAIPVDTHVFRVGWRLGLYDRKVGEAKAHDMLLGLVPPELAFRFHTTLIQHGRHLCSAQKPRCPECPVRDRCAWRTSGEAEAPEARKKPK